MQLVLIDTFVVPEHSKAELVETSRRTAEFIRTRPGYVEGFIFEKIAGDSPNNIITTAVWESEEAFKDAMHSVLAEYERIGFRKEEVLERLQAQIDRAMYKRIPY